MKFSSVIVLNMLGLGQMASYYRRYRSYKSGYRRILRPQFVN